MGQEIRLGVAGEEVEALPPLPPGGTFDVRVAVDRIDAWQVPLPAEPRTFRLRLQGEVKRMRWSLPAEQNGEWQLGIDGEVIDLKGRGTVAVSSLSEAWVGWTGGLPERDALAPNYPNPFNPSTTIRYDLPEGGEVSLWIYDVTGQQVRELAEGYHSAGSYHVVWDGRDDQGILVANGVYLYELRAGDYRAIRKMVLMK